MRTSATNRRLHTLLTSITKTLIPRPDFQRRLVWSNIDKVEFIRTAIDGLPFPEIYIAAGELNPETGEATELLVDGQQRVTTLYEYFRGSSDLKLPEDIPPYASLDTEKKKEFLEYEVVVRDLGNLPIDQIRTIFERINSANYALNAMEIHNARYGGAYKKFAEALVQNEFFVSKRIFTANEIRRMQDIRFGLILTTTILSSYFNRDDDIEEYLIRYNDSFEEAGELNLKLNETFKIIDGLHIFSHPSQWKKNDVFALTVEIYRAKFTRNVIFDLGELSSRLQNFFNKISNPSTNQPEDDLTFTYIKSSAKSTNDRNNRLRRGETIQAIIDPTYKIDESLLIRATSDQLTLDLYTPSDDNDY